MQESHGEDRASHTDPESGRMVKLALSEFDGFMVAFGDMPLWNSLASCVVLPYISPYGIYLPTVVYPAIAHSPQLSGGEVQAHTDSLRQ
jgi:hypothetical protein